MPQTTSSLADTLGRFAAIARPEIRRDHILPSCIAATWITVAVMRGLGLRAEHCEVVASVGNKTYAALWRLYGPPKTREELDEWTRKGSNIVGIGHERGAGGIGGHLVAVVEDTYVVDASLDQVADPTTGLAIPPVFVMRIDPRGIPYGIMRDVSGTLFVEYVKRRTLSDYTVSPDWGRTSDVLDAVERILVLMRA
jgi:hypothetical protein